MPAFRREIGEEGSNATPCGSAGAAQFSAPATVQLIRGEDQRDARSRLLRKKEPPLEYPFHGGASPATLVRSTRSAAPFRALVLAS